MSDDTPDLASMTPEQIAEQLTKQFDPERDDKPDATDDEQED